MRRSRVCQRRLTCAPMEPTHDDDPVLERPVPRPGYEEIPLDLDAIPAVEEGLAAASDRGRLFLDAVREVFPPGQRNLMFKAHLPFVSFVNRANSLHLAIIDAVRAGNPHAAFTLLRAYLELVVLVYYLIDNPAYLDALERPMSELPKGTRLRWAQLFEFAGKDMPGVRTVYDRLNEIAHFGSAALWTPFKLGDDEDDRRLSFSTAPHWKSPDDARMALAMLLENDLTIEHVLRQFADKHIRPSIDAHAERSRMRAALAAAGATPPTDEREIGTLPPDHAEELFRLGLVTWCEEHQALEAAEGVGPEELEGWLSDRTDRALRDQDAGGGVSRADAD